MLSRWSKNLAKLDFWRCELAMKYGTEIQAWQAFSIVEATFFGSIFFQTKYFFKRSKLQYKASLEASFCRFWSFSDNFLSFFREVTCIDHLILEDSRWFLISCKSKGKIRKCQKKMRNNDFHQLQHSSVVKTSVLGNWTNFEVDRTKIGMYMAIQIENLVLVPLTFDTGFL